MSDFAHSHIVDNYIVKKLEDKFFLYNGVYSTLDSLIMCFDNMEQMLYDGQFRKMVQGCG